MKKVYVSILAMAAALAPLAADAWTPAGNHISTPWSAEVENEVNGLMTYDRKVIKVDEDRLRKANKALCNSLNK